MTQDWSKAVDAALTEDDSLRTSAAAAQGKAPEAVAKARKLGQPFGVAADIVADAPEEFELAARQRDLDALQARQPQVATFLHDPERMALAGDDLDGLSLVARSIENLLPFGRKQASRFVTAPLRGLQRARAGDSATAGTVGAIAGTADTLFDTLDASNPLRPLFESLAQVSGDPAEAATLQQMADPLGFAGRRDAAAAVGAEARADLARIGRDVGGLPSGADWLRDPAGAFEQATAHLAQQSAASAPLMAAGIAAAAATRSPQVGASILGVPTGAMTSAELRADGVDRFRAGVAGIGTGFAEVIGEEFALASILLPKWRRALLAAPATEYGQEFVTQLAQEGIENTTRGQPLDPWTMLEHAHDAGLTGAFTGLVAAGGRAAIAAPLEYRDRRRANAVNTRLNDVLRSAQGAIELGKLTEAAAALKLGERAPDVAEAFVAHLGGEGQQVYLPAGEFRALFQDEAPALAAELTGDPAALDALGEHGDLVIPLAKYVAVVARLPAAPQVAEIARLDPDGYSRRDLEGLDLDAEVGAMAASEPAAEAPDLKTGLLAALQASGRYSDADADLMAGLTAKMLGTLAARTGQDPMALLQRYQLRINGQPAYNATPTGDDNGTSRGPDARAVPGDAGGTGTVRGGDGVLAQPGGPDQGPRGREPDGSLGGLPRLASPGGEPASAFGPAHDVARAYREQSGLGEAPVSTYARVERERAVRIADAYEAMPHNPRDPEVAAAYAAMVAETLAQYRAILDAGLTVEFITGEDPYAGNPRALFDDVRNNNHMWVFSTRDGFGSDASFDPVENPLLGATEFTDASGAPMLANDVFRVVHDYFGHVKEGVGFRADGEENAWRAHAAMYSPLARRAMTTETRGQNSWVNFGPHGEANRTASATATIYADQKIGLLPEWVSEEGRTDDQEGQVLAQAADAGGAAPARRAEGDAVAGVQGRDGRAPARGSRAQGRGAGRKALSRPEVRFAFHPIQPDAVAVDVYHHSTTAGLSALDPTMAGTGAAGGERRRFGMGRFGTDNPRTYWYATGTQPEDIVPRKGTYAVTLENLYDADADPRGFGIEAGANADYFEELVADAGFDGFVTEHSILGRVAVTLGFDAPIPVQPAEGMVLYQGERASDPTTTPAFKAWFGDSKVVDADGKPLVVYHGTASEFSVFDGGRGGFYFTDDKKAAQEYANHADGDSDPRVVGAYLSIQNPMVLDRAWYDANVREEGGDSNWEAVDNAAYQAEQEGHDGLILQGFPDFDGMPNGLRAEREYDQYIAFRPEQIKSATSNNGAFDPANPSILFQTAERNELGLYSAVEQAVIDMPLPAWKKADGKAAGAEVWAKLSKTPGVKAEELKWLGVEEFLTATNSSRAGWEAELVPDSFAIERGTNADGIPLSTGTNEYAVHMQGKAIGTFRAKNPREAIAAAMDAATRDNIELPKAQPPKFTRDEVLAFVRDNGVRVEPIVADEEERASEGHEFAWDLETEDDPGNWEYRVDDLMGDFDLDDAYWWAWDDWIDGHQDEIRTMLGEDADNYRVEDGEDGGFDVFHDSDDETPVRHFDTRAEADGFIDAQASIEWDKDEIENHPAGGYDKLAELARDEARELADETARDEYFNDPVVRYHDATTDITIIGNDDLGYRVEDANGHLIEEGVWQFRRAEAAAEQWWAENGDSRNDSDEESKVAKWGHYLTPGRRDNYREYKLTLPDVPGSFVHLTHFDDENIVAFLRVTDRELAAQASEPTELTDEEVRAQYPAIDDETWQRIVAGDPEVLAEWSSFEDFKRRAEEAVHATRTEPSNPVPTFFVEELQSDWHQQGRQRGYKDDDEAMRLEAAAQEATETTRAIRAELAELFIAAGMEEFLGDRARLARAEGDPQHVIALAVGGGMDVERLQTPEIAEAMGRWLEADRAEDRALQAAGAARRGVPDAPFKNDGWLSLAIKSALVGAVEQDKAAFAWADAQTLVERWSESYRKLYETQYDTKMVSMVKKLTGVAPQHFTLDGQPYPDTAALDAELQGAREAMAAREKMLEDRIKALPGFPAEATVQEQAAWVNAHPEAAAIQREAEEVRDARNALHEADKPQGYWIIPLDDALQAKIEREAFPLFQKGEASPRGQLAIGNDRRMAITLFEGADRSTFFHESAHFFLEVMTDLAADPDAPAQVREDLAAIRRFVGNAGGAFTTEQHEQWARAFEAYLREGRAPAPDLITPFARFRRWLTDLYRAIAQLGVELDEEIRGVMDRLIAVDEEIELVRAQQSVAPLVERKEAAGLGLSEAEWDTYAGMLEAAVEEARADVTAKVLRARRREAEAAWREEAARVRADIDDALERSPAFRAWRILTGRTPKGDPAPVEGITLDRAALAARYTPAQMKALRSLSVYRVAGGLDPDAAAEALGFDSGDALVQALLTIRPAQAAIPGEVEAEMRRRHPDPLDDLSEEVTRALYRSRRVAVLEHELALLARLAQQPAPRPGALRAIAERVVAGKSLRKLRPNDYLVAERRAAREATKAAAKGDFAEALRHKREQALQAALYARARTAQDTGQRQVTALRRAASLRTRERIGKAGKEYVEALDALLEAHELRSVSGKTVTRREALRAWVEAAQADHDETAVSEALLARVERERVVNVADLTLAELGELHEAVKNLLHLARLKNTLLANADARTWEEARGELLARARQSLAEGAPLPFSDADMGRLDSMGDLYGDLMDWVLQPETVIEWLDGGETGPWHDYLWNQAERAQAERERLRRMVVAPMQAILAGHPDRKSLDRRVFVRALNRSVSRHTLIAVALNVGNVGNTDKLMRGGFAIDGVQVPFSQEALAEMLGYLTADDARMVQRVWDAVETLWPEIVKQQEALTGLAPPKIEARPLTIAGVALRGGYYPLAYDPRSSTGGVKQAQAQEDRLFGGAFTKAVTSKGHTVERTDYAAPLLLDYHAVLTRHLNDVITDLSHRRFVKQALRILSDNEIKGVIHQRLTGGAYHALLGSVRHAVNGIHAIAEPASRGIQSLVRGAMTNTAVAALGFKIGLTIANLVSAPVQAGARVSTRYLIEGFTRYYAHPARMTGLVHELSPMMLARAEGHDVSYEQVIAQLRGKRGVREKIVLVSLACHRLIVPLVERAVWLGRYLQAGAEGAPMDEAARLADKAIRQTQTKHAPKDLSAAERDPRYTLFNLFLGPMVVINNRLQDAGLRGKLRGTVETPAEALGTWLAMVAGGALIFELASGRGPDDDDDDGLDAADWAGWIARKALLFPLQTMPFIRNAANALDYRFEGGVGSARPDPLTDAMAAMVRWGFTTGDALGDWWSGEDVDTARVVKDSAQAAGVAVGLPTSQAMTTGQYLYDVGTGAYTPDNPAEAAKYLIYRRPKDE